jgi:hypothetical protein
MEPPITGHDAISRDDMLVHNWRVSQLARLGIPGLLAEIYADRIDWTTRKSLSCLPRPWPRRHPDVAKSLDADGAISAESPESGG